MDWHTISAKHALEKTHSNKDGLTPERARERLKRDGENALKEAPGEPLWRKLLSQFTDVMIIILLIAAAVSALLGEFVDSAAIMAIVVLNAVLGFVQEYRAEKALRALKKLSALQATVLRGGRQFVVDARELVQGDVIILGEGDRVPADCLLLECIGLQVDEALLTGESLPVEKDVKARPGEKAALSDRKNMVYSGTAVVRGRGRALVVETGMKTEMGKIAGLVQETESGRTPLQEQLAELGKALGFIALTACAVIFFVGVSKGYAAMEMFLISVSLAVAAIPSGLPAVVTITLAIGVQRMSARHAIIRKLPAMETLGAATVICSDKTGTLTKNEMTVREVYADGKRVAVSGDGYSLIGAYSGLARSDKELSLMLETACLCNNSSLAFDSKKEKASVLGDPTEASLLIAAEKAGISYEALREKHAFASENPFTSERKMMSVTRKHGSAYRVHAKGAPEELLKQCDRALKGGRTVKLTAQSRKKILDENERMASKALRVLAFAYKDSKRKDNSEDRLVFLGLAGMMDPPRPEAAEAIRLCRRAGIKVVMITGDNPRTAVAIGSELGLMGPKDRVLTGPELDEMHGKLEQMVGEVRIYARVSPEHKLMIVNALKARGEVVAMTGDGVNDAPAIKRADIGVSMGITGTDVAKEASEMIVTDDNFASIVAAVEEGRTIYSNIVKAVTYLLSCNTGEVITVFVAIISGLPSPLSALQILWMNFVTDSTPALALAVEPAEKNVMNNPPRDKNKPILGWHNAKRFALVGAWMAAGTLLMYTHYLPQGIPKAETVAFSTIVMFQLFYALDCRSGSHLVKAGLMTNNWMWGAFAFGIALQATVVYAPFAQELFKTVALEALDVALVFATASSLLIASQAVKAFNARS